MTDWDAELDLRLARELDSLWHQVAPGPDTSALRTALLEAVEGGKRVRPRLVRAVHEALGGTRHPAVLGAAAAVELLHTAFVIHDDVIDGDDLRRGRPSVPGRFRELARARGASPESAGAYAVSGAVLVGDLALSAALRAFGSLAVPADAGGRVLGLVGQAVATSATGELADVRLTLDGHVPTDEEVLDLAARKTAAYSFVLPMQLGAVLAGSGDDVVELLAQAGRSWGIAFQLLDDVAGLFDDTELTGKDHLGDLREGKATMLTCHARTTPAWAVLEPVLGSPLATTEDLHRVRRALEKHGSRAHVESAAADHLRAGAASAAEAGIGAETTRRLTDLLGSRTEVAA
jgi:geranylgeranyl diphosphate synthase type II